MKARILFPVLVISLGLLMPQVSAAETQLNYAPAKRAMQAKADRFAGKQTKITFMFRLKPMVYSGRAEWDQVDPTGCKGCGYDPVTGEIYDTPSNESCSVSMVAKKLTSGRIRVRIDSSLCF
jgi:hypothetical protein